MFQNISRLQLPEIKLLGLKSRRTNNIREKSPSTAVIAPTFTQYFTRDLASSIPQRTKPGRTFNIYTDYDSDHTGNYIYFIGEEVENCDHIPEDLAMHIIPSQMYVKFTTQVGPIPHIVIEAWQEIWKMNEDVLQGPRNYLSDFEIYDQRALDKKHAMIDIYVGIGI